MEKSYKTVLNSQIPARLQTKEYNVLLNLVKKRNLRNKEELVNYLKDKETTLREWLQANRQGAGMGARKQKTSELKFISFVKNRFFRYLR